MKLAWETWGCLVLLLALGGGYAWFTITVRNFMRDSQETSRALLAERNLNCPPGTQRQEGPSGKAGWSIFCASTAGLKHGPWLAADNGLLTSRGRYIYGKPSGERYDASGALTNSLPGQEWEEALGLALDHSEAAKKRLEELQGSADNGATRRLAGVLLEEWSLALDDGRVSSPYPVWRPELDLNGEKVTKPLVVILGRVRATGEFVPEKIHHGSGNETVDELCLEVARSALYRPARTAEGYVEGWAGLQILFHFH